MTPREAEAGVLVRSATVEDYPSFLAMFPELLVDDPIPGPGAWASTYVPSTCMAVRGDEVVGYCYWQEYAQLGYVRNIVVVPSARRAGVGKVLMRATAETLRAHGKRSWCLNVKPGNRAALALYASVGLQPQYSSRALRFDWSALPALPPGNALVRELTARSDGAAESRFDLPGGQLAFARGSGRVMLEAVSQSSAELLGVSVFDPKFPGAFPFRVTRVEALRPLLEAMRVHVPTDDSVGLVIENDEPLAALLTAHGAKLRIEIVHLKGTL